MSTRSPTNDLRSQPDSGRFERLYLQLVKTYYEDANFERATDVAAQLEACLAASHEYAHSIRGEEVRSIIAELRDDLPKAIQSREAEIRKILELHERAANTRSWGYVSRLYDHSDVSDRLDLLAILYDRHGDLDRAIAILTESKQYCMSREIPFDAQDLLDEFDRARIFGTALKQTESVSREILDKAIRRAYEAFGAPADVIVVIDEKSRQFTAEVNRLLPDGVKVSTEHIKKRLLTLRRRGQARGGLPRLKRRLA